MRVVWADDESKAYLIDERGNIVGRWFRDSPGMNTFDPATYTYGQGYGFQDPEQGQGWMYNAWRGGDPGGNNDDWLQDPNKLGFDEDVRRWELDYEDRQREREEFQRQFDERIALDARRLEEEIRMERERMAHETGLEKLRSENRIREMERQHQLDVQYLALDWAERHKALDKELVFYREELESKERLAAAETWARPFDYLAYARWMSGQPASTTESGVPVGAPDPLTGEPAPAVGGDPVATGGPDPYGQQLAAGSRIQEFGAWGGPTGPVGGTPWVAPHQANLSQFANMPQQAQEMAYARWRRRGIMPESAQQAMYASAPVGTAGQRVPGYG